MHYVLVLGVITLYIYFRFGPKALAGSFFIFGLIAISRGLIVMAIPLFIMAYFLLRKSDLLLEAPWSKTPKTSSDEGSSNGFNKPDAPTISSRYLEIKLFPEVNKITGKVTAGPRANQLLDTLSLESLNELLKYYSDNHKESELVLKAYLDANYENWRSAVSGYYETSNSSNPAISSVMNKREALMILGLGFSATIEEIKASHRKLMKSYHPDQGGSLFLAAKINTAKDYLLA